VSISCLGSISTLELCFAGLPGGRLGSLPTGVFPQFYPHSEMSPAMDDLTHRIFASAVFSFFKNLLLLLKFLVEYQSSPLPPLVR